MKLILTRLSDDGVQTLGNLDLYDSFGVLKTYRTLELSWNDNKKNISCIPPGIYDITTRNSPKYPRHLHVKNVPNRELILIHHGNYKSQTRGCILVGKTFADINADGFTDITNSKMSIEELFSYVWSAENHLHEKVTLEIRNAYGNNSQQG